MESRRDLEARPRGDGHQQPAAGVRCALRESISPPITVCVVCVPLDRAPRHQRVFTPKCQPAPVLCTRACPPYPSRRAPGADRTEENGGTVDVGATAYRERAGRARRSLVVHPWRTCACRRRRCDERRRAHVVQQQREGSARGAAADRETRLGLGGGCVKGRRRTDGPREDTQDSGLISRTRQRRRRRRRRRRVSGPRQHARAHRAGPVAPGGPGCVATWIPRSAKEIRHFSDLEKKLCAIGGNNATVNYCNKYAEILKRGHENICNTLKTLDFCQNKETKLLPTNNSTPTLVTCSVNVVIII